MVSLAPLDQLGWLSTQPEQLQKWAARVGRGTPIAVGEDLYRSDQPPDAVYGLAQGCLEVSVPVPDGDVVSVYFAEPGFWAGESAILSRAKRTMSLTAVTESRVFRIRAPAVLDYWRCPRLLAVLLRTKSCECDISHSRVCSCTHRVEQRQGLCNVA